ncbi:hypothetical protein [Streptomyces coeruleofuscus]|uniref:Uncharacterized protein n=1 Tax=Streptomyces coeruleofuscus TaxID=66879 RepID=A0ABP5URA4_9ACTN
MAAHQGERQGVPDRQSGEAAGSIAVPDADLVGQAAEGVGGLGPVPSGEAERRQ